MPERGKGLYVSGGEVVNLVGQHEEITRYRACRVCRIANRLCSAWSALKGFADLRARLAKDCGSQPVAKSPLLSRVPDPSEVPARSSANVCSVCIIQLDGNFSLTSTLVVAWLLYLVAPTLN